MREPSTVAALGACSLLASVALVACVVGSQPPRSAPIAGSPTGQPTAPSADPDTFADSEERSEDTAPSKFTLVDVDTGKPIAGALVTVADQDVESDSNGVVTVTLPFGIESHALVRHPGYITFKGPVTDQGGTLMLRARSASTFAEVVATGAAQVVRVGDVTLSIPAGSVAAGTRLEFGLLDRRNIPEVQYRLDPSQTAPIGIRQLAVDVPGRDDARFARVINPDKPIHASWRLSPDEFLQLASFDPEIVFSAGQYAETLPAESLRFDPKTYEVGFDITHFSDVTITQHAEISKGCDGEAVALHWWRVDHHKPTLEEGGPTPGVSQCAEKARPLTITASETDTLIAKGSFATNWKTSVKFDFGSTVGADAAALGNGGKVSVGGTWSWAYDYTRTHTGGFNMQSTRKVTVTRSKICPANTSCVGALYIVMDAEHLEVVHKWILLSDLQQDPDFNTQIIGRFGGTEGYGKPDKCLHLTKKGGLDPSSVPIDADSFNIMMKQLAKKLEGNPDYEIKNEKLKKQVHSESFTVDTRRFKDAYMTLKEVPPTCPAPGGGAGSGGEVIEVTPPPRSEACTVPHPPKRPRVVTPPGVDSLVKPEGTVVLDRTVEVESTSIHIVIKAGKTRASELQEVARAIACCPDEEDKVSFSSEVALGLGAAQQGGHNTGFTIGLKESAEATAGIDIGVFTAKGSVKADAAQQAGITWAWINTLEQAFAVARGSSKEIVAKATATDCEAKGLYAYLYNADYAIQTVIKGSVWNSDLTLPATLQFYGTPLEGETTLFKNHCGDDHKHTTTETPPSETPAAPPPGTPDKTKDEHSSVPRPPGTFCAGLQVGSIGELGNEFGVGELALQVDGCVRFLSGRLAAVVSPTWYHGQFSDTFAFPVGVEGTLPLGDTAPNVDLIARAQGGYVYSTSSVPGASSTSGGVLMPELGARYHVGDRAFFGATPLSLPVFFGPSTVVGYRVTVSGGTTF
jgi:hypothetical protein